MRKITPTQAKILYQTLLNHDAGTLATDLEHEPRNLNIALDQLRLALLKIAKDGE